MNAQQILDDLTARGVRIWAEADRLKLDAPVGVVTAEDKAKLTAAKPELMAALSRPGICPACQGELDQQSATCWWCAGCRAFLHPDGRPMAAAVIPKQETLEVYEAKRLLADILAAGCEIRVTGGDIAISNLGKLSEEIWARLEQAASSRAGDGRRLQKRKRE